MAKSKEKTQNLALYVTHEHICGYGSPGSVKIDISIVRLNDGDDSIHEKERFPHVACDQYADKLYRDVSAIVYLRRGEEPYLHFELEARDLHSVNVRDMKRLIAAIEHIDRQMLKMREDCGEMKTLGDYVKRLATAIKSDTVFVSNATRRVADNVRKWQEPLDDRKDTRYSRQDAAWFMETLVREVTEVKQADATEAA